MMTDKRLPFPSNSAVSSKDCSQFLNNLFKILKYHELIVFLLIQKYKNYIQALDKKLVKDLSKTQKHEFSCLTISSRFYGINKVRMKR